MRVKRGLVSHAKHKKVFEANKGYRMTRHRLIKVAKESALHAGEYAFMGRKKRKRDFRSFWITRINGALENMGVSYSQLIAGLKKAKIELDRKILAELASQDFETFKKVVEKTQG